MIFTSLATLLLASTAAAQSSLPSDLIGTWSTGSKKVITGSGFADPANGTFTYPATTGVSYSFSSEYYEVARYRFVSNATDPNCITGVMNWAHGTYEILANGSIVLTSFGDGFQQIQDPCAAVSNFVEVYNQTELLRNFIKFVDVNDGDKLHLFQFDGTPLAPMFRVAADPTMLPTQKLRNETTNVATSNAKRSLQEDASNGAQRVWETSTALVACAILGAISFL